MSLSVKIRQEVERLSLFIALAMVLLTALFAYRAWASFEDARQEALNTRHVVDATGELVSSLKDAETAQRGFLLTGNDRYLEPYRDALRQIPANLEALAHAEIRRRSPEDVQRIDRLKPLVAGKLDELAQTIELRRTEGLAAALAIVTSDRGKGLMDSIRGICAGIETKSQDLLVRQRERLRVRALEAGLISTAGSAAVFLLLTLATVTIRRGSRQRQRLIESLRRSESQARLAHELLQITISSIGDGVMTTDTSGNVVFLNPVAESLTGWPQADAAGKRVEEVFKISDEMTRAPVVNPVSAALREKKAVNLANHTQLTTRDGRDIPIEDSAAPIRDAQGVITGVILVFRDVTRRRAADLAEKKAAADLARHSELLQRTNAELQHFTYAASHDLREPLRTIIAYTQLVQLRGAAQLDSKNAECLKFVVEAALRMSQLIDALLDYSRAGEVTNRPVETLQMDDLLARVLANLHGSIEENRAVVTHDPLPTIVGDQIHLEQVLQNLIGNALKYRSQQDPRVHVAACDQGQEWLFSVADNGQGIAAQYQAQIFEVFKRLHGTQYSGAGIGLATCQRLVERYGGRIWVESEVGKGSIFFFTLPNGKVHEPSSTS